MEKPTNEERNEQEQAPTQVDVSKLSLAQKQLGIDRNMTSMVMKFVGELNILEGIVGQQVDVRVNAKLPDGRKIHIKVR